MNEGWKAFHSTMTIFGFCDRDMRFGRNRDDDLRRQGDLLGRDNFRTQSELNILGMRRRRSCIV